MSGLTRPGWHVMVAGAALLAEVGGAMLITMADHETPMPGRPTGTDSAVTDETLI